MHAAFIRFGHGYEQSDRGRCEAFDGFEIIAAPLGDFDAASRDSRIFRRGTGNAVDYGSHAIKLAKLSGCSGGLYILMQHGGGREVLAVPSFGDLEAAILAMPERVQYALLYTVWQTAKNARNEAQDQTAQRWATAYKNKRIRQRRATRTRGPRVEIIPEWEIALKAEVARRNIKEVTS
ncbi:hypothetical protein [Aminobacter sp. MET-1]|uniref:hypothetical protein n=1 Tax=Aminobacter sp. MET-1 TaxID=2951085 RepID=UPI002269F251|nr:hypothetical protein [Aminobacter sp. MET-1]MCX8571085.1 hypothetical protein [Aminobacter sp. MET-1]MCX8573246.1 hypothetical protein [Aminobacter sp. MET-1]